jgi:hypothetical protein
MRRARYIGVRVGGEPRDETDPFYVCDKCGQAVDRRDLLQVLEHEVPGHSAGARQ